MIEDKREGLVGASGFQPLTSWIPTRESKFSLKRCKRNDTCGNRYSSTRLIVMAGGNPTHKRLDAFITIYPNASTTV
jgi:hypothetical protein